MTQHVLFIQGAGEGAHDEDAKLVQSLRASLGTEYEIFYPKLPNDGDAEYGALKARISEELASLNGPLILVGHSAGGSLLLKYLSEEDFLPPLSGVFIIAAPYFGAGGWQVDEAALGEDFAARLANAPSIYFYHSRDDEVVPFEHLALYAQQLPQATIREFDGRGHQFRNDLSEVAADIKTLHRPAG